MAQWGELLKLDPARTSPLRGLYMERKFPIDVRRWLCDWIESQDWDLAAADERTASTCFQTLLLKLDELHNSSLMGTDYSVFKFHLLNHFEQNPPHMAAILAECLKEENNILDSCSVKQHCSSNATDQCQTDMDNKVSDLENQVKKTEEEIKALEKLESIQKTCEAEQMNGLSRSQIQEDCRNQVNLIMTTIQEVLPHIAESVKLANLIVETLITVELPEWKRRQQLACIGNPVCPRSLDHLQKWFTIVAEMLLQIRQQLEKLQEQGSRHQINRLPEVINPVDTFTKSLLIKLLQNALVVENQPVMFSQTHRPLVLKTIVTFTVTIRFLANLSHLKYGCLVQAEFDKDVEEIHTIKGLRQFAFKSETRKVLDLNTQKGGLMAQWDMSIKEDKTKSKRSNECPIKVTEELHIIKFSTELRFADLECHVETSSLPVVVVSSTSQAPSAWATVLWYNLLSSPEHRSLSMFVEPPPLSWEQLSQALSWQFISAGNKGLNEDQLSELKDKIVDDPDELVSWSKFSKKEGPWLWIDGILDLIEKYLKELWKDGCIMGFVDKEKARMILQNKQSGNFLLRFSESNREGAITFSWVEQHKGEAIVHAIDPFTKEELSEMSLADHINHYRLKKRCTNPLVYLYPDIPKDKAFGPYYKPHKKNKPYVRRIKVSEGDLTPPPSPLGDMNMDMDMDIDTDKLILEEMFEIYCQDESLPNASYFDVSNFDFIDDTQSNTNLYL